MEITILGCGASSGCPYPGCKCQVCSGRLEKNLRTRSSVFIKHNNKHIIIDTGPDLRFQMIREDIYYFDYILYSHFHRDHMTGMDDLRASFVNKNHLLGNKMDGSEISSQKNYSLMQVYTNLENMGHCIQCFDYLFSSLDNKELNIYKPGSPMNPLEGYIINDYDVIQLEDLKIESFLQTHGKIKTLGYKIGNFVYSADANIIPEKSLIFLANSNIDLWIISLTYFEDNSTHAGIETILSWVKIVKPKRIVFTHMSHEIDYYDITRFNSFKGICDVEFGFDGMKFVL